jgi:hypothetical protein
MRTPHAVSAGPRDARCRAVLGTVKWRMRRMHIDGWAWQDLGAQGAAPRRAGGVGSGGCGPRVEDGLLRAARRYRKRSLQCRITC